MAQETIENIEEAEGDSAANSGKYVSERGPFEIWENPAITPPESADGLDAGQVTMGLDMSALAAKYGEEAVRQKAGEMIKAFAPGTSSQALFAQNVPGGMSLIYVWFGANFPLFRHSHPALGDCLYYVVAGEVLVGKRHLGPGSGFFVPTGHPYTYTAGPAGAEVLEFRTGGGVEGAPVMTLHELSLDSIQQITDRCNELRQEWQQPARIGDTAFVQRELDLVSSPQE